MNRKLSPGDWAFVCLMVVAIVSIVFDVGWLNVLVCVAALVVIAMSVVAYLTAPKQDEAADKALRATRQFLEACELAGIDEVEARDLLRTSIRREVHGSATLRPVQ